MSRMQAVLSLYSKMVEKQPFNRYSKNEKEILENCQWIKRAEKWGELHVDAWGKFTGLYQ